MSDVTKCNAVVLTDNYQNYVGIQKLLFLTNELFKQLSLAENPPDFETLHNAPGASVGLI